MSSDNDSRGSKGSRGARDEHRGRDAYSHRLKRLRSHAMKPPIVDGSEESEMMVDASIDCGWGRVVFGQTFSDTRLLIETLRGRSARPSRHRDLCA